MTDSSLQFKNQDLNLSQDEDSSNGKSAYVKALCLGIENQLDKYRNLILKIEKDYLKNRSFTLTGVQVRLSDFFYILPELD